MKSISFGNRIIGEGHPLYFIADIGANHDRDLQRAFDLIHLAKEAGAHAAKFQHFQAAKIVSKYGFDNLGMKLSHQANWKKGVYEIYEEASVALEWTSKLQNKCKEVGIDFFTSPYDHEAVDFVDQFVDLYKIGSGDITWTDILEHIARKGKPVLLATGASNMDDVKRAMNILKEYTSDIVLMQCNTNYTVEPDKYRYVNLNVLKTYANIYPDTILGLSDHTMGHATVLGAVALGALVIEKHFTDNNDREGPDHKFAMNPKSWKIMVDYADEVYSALGDGVKRIEQNELLSMVVQRRCLRATKHLPVGHTIKAEDLEALRPIPEGGLPPYMIGELVGKKLAQHLDEGEHVTLNHF